MKSFFSIVRRSLVLLVALFLFEKNAQAQDGYEYWFDNDITNRMGADQNVFQANGFNHTIPVNTLPEGFHTFNIRFRRQGSNSDPNWSAVSQYRFLKKSLSMSTARGYEYWYDDQFDSRIQQNLSASSGDAILIQTDNSIEALDDGLHELNIRVWGEHGWSAVSTFRFLKKSPVAGGTYAYEYWLDQDFDNRTLQSLSAPGNNTLIVQPGIDITAVPPGLHTFSLRVCGENGWSSVSTYRFFKKNPALPGGISAWEYWLNDDFSQAKRIFLNPPAQDILMLNEMLDIDTLCKGKYVFNARFLGENGWSSVVRDTFDKTSPAPGEEIAAFETVIDGNQVSFLNGSSNTQQFRWFFGDGQVDTLRNPYHQYATFGAYQAILVAYGGCQNDTLRKSVILPGISGFSPKRGGRNGVTTMLFSGVGFMTDNMEVRLKRSGQADLIPVSILVPNGTQMSAKFKFQNAQSGLWDVFVRFPGGATVTFPNGFTIEDSSYYKLSVKITCNWRMRTGVKNPMTVTVVNEGNADAAMVPLTVSGFPKGTSINMVNERIGIENLTIFDTLDFLIDTIPVFFYDSLKNSMYLPLILPQIEAGQSITIQLEATPPVSADNQWINLAAEIGKPLFEELIDAPTSSLGSCLFEIFFKAVTDELGQAQDCLAQISGWATTTIKGAFDLADADKGDKVEYFAGLFHGFVEMFVECADAADVVIPIGKAVKILRNTIEIYQNIRDYYDIYQDCVGPLSKIGIDLTQVRVGNSFDPNIKIGPGGGSSAHYYATESGPLVYIIQCENDTSALFAAQTVTIVDTLDLSKFDTTTFRFTHVSVAGYFVSINTPNRQFIRDIWLPTGVIARTSGRFDPQKGIVTWVFRTIDPATGQETTDPVAGILQPNFNPPEGDGSVGFSIHKKPDVPDSVLILNQATIIFDLNEPISTNIWGIVSDNIAPVSAIDPLPAMQDSANIHLTWSGEDNLSGVQYYQLWVSDNGGTFYQWRSYEPTTTATFSGLVGHTYRFYSIAVDSAGNVEAPPMTFDAQIKVDGIIQTHTPGANQGYLLAQNKPNPFSEQTQIDFVLPENCSWIRLQIVSATGITLRSFNYNNPQAGEYAVLFDSDNLPSGVYYYQLMGDNVRLTRRMVILGH